MSRVSPILVSLLTVAYLQVPPDEDASNTSTGDSSCAGDDGSQACRR